MFNQKLSKKEILDRIGYFLNKKKMSAYSLSLTLGKSSNYIYRIQSGRTNIYLDILLDILEILDVSLFEFTYPDLENFSTDLKMLDLIKKLENQDK